jgi:hypothetical protein
MPKHDPAECHRVYRIASLKHIVGLLVVLLLLGCVAEKESWHEEDHELPPHWPLNIEDAAQKIQQRLDQTGVEESLATTREELTDLIEWVPEVAADTDLVEDDWVPIYELSETLRRHLSAKDVTLNECREDIDRLVVLLRESLSKLPKPVLVEEVN